LPFAEIAMLSLPVKPSRLEFMMTVSSQLLALLGLTHTNLPLPLLAIVGALLILALRATIVRARAGRSGSLQRIDITSQNSFFIYPGKHVTATLPRVRYFSEWLIVLQFDPLLTADAGATKMAGDPTIIWLFPDSLDANSDRLLRCYLRFECPTTG